MACAQDPEPRDPFVGETAGETMLRNGRLLLSQLLEVDVEGRAAAVFALDPDDLRDIALFTVYAEAAVTQAIREGHTAVRPGAEL